MPSAAEAYHALANKKWWTNRSGKADARGRREIRAFFGKHRVTAGGKALIIDLGRSDPTQCVSLRVKPRKAPRKDHTHSWRSATMGSIFVARRAGT